jgi:drug/metabolite transporter (DMT)-like permease
MSLFLWGSSSFLVFGLEYVSAADSAVLSYSAPLFAIPLSFVILSEKPTKGEWGGAIVGFVGVLVYSFALAGQTLTVIGGMLTLVNAFFWAIFTVYCRKVRDQEATMTVATQLLFVALLYLPCAPLNYKLVIAPNFCFDMAYLSVLSAAAGFYLWNGIVRSRRIGKASTLVYLVPVTATLVQIVQTFVIPDLLTLTGLGLMILGLYLSNGTIPLQANSKRLGAKISRMIPNHSS